MPKRYEAQIARRLFFSQQGTSSAAKPAVHVAFAGIVVGVAIMIVSLCVVIGFKQTITEKVAGFGAHIQVLNFDNNNTFEMEPVAVSDSLIEALRSLPHVASANLFATKPSILKTDSAFQGIVFKGLPMDHEAAMAFYKRHLVEGNMPASQREVLISRSLAQLMELKVGDAFVSWFVGEQVRARKLVISGLYETGLSEMDLRFVLGDIEVVRRLNGWLPNQASGIEVRADKLSNLAEADDEVFFKTANRLDEEGNAFHVVNLIQLNPQIFAWLDLLDMNVIIIILLMLAVSGFSIISGLIILILDNVRLIGTLKALGADNGFVRRIFRYQSAWLIGQGMLLGNGIGLALVAIQYFTHLIPLEAATYYVSYVPVTFPWFLLLVLNVGVLLVSLLILIGPSYIVTRISPARTLRFE